MARTVAEHLRTLHETMAAHHADMAKAHQQAMDGEEEGTSRYEFHKAAMAACQKAADSHAEHATGFSIGGFHAKGEDVGDLAKRLDGLVPTQVSAINPGPFRAIPRAGGPEIGAFGKVADSCVEFVKVD